MKLGIVIRRANQWRWCEGTALVATARGHDVYVLGRPKPGDAKHTVSRERLPYWVHYRGPDDLTPAMDAWLVPAALDIDPRGIGGICAALQTSWSDLVYLNPEHWDVVYSWSSAWLGFWQERQERLFPRNFVPVGHPMSGPTDPLPLPPKSVLYYPFPWGAHHLDSLFWLKMQFEDRRTVKAARQAADKLGWPLVVSARDKVYLPEYTRDAADVVANQDPVTLLNRAGLFIHHCSSGVAEAVLANVPSWNVAPRGWNAYAGRGVDFNPWSERNFYSWPGTGMRYEAAYGFVPFGMIESARQEYIERYLGWADGKAGLRIVMDLEDRVASGR